MLFSSLHAWIGTPYSASLDQGTVCRFDTCQQVVFSFWDAVCKAAEGLTLEVTEVGASCCHLVLNARVFSASLFAT